MTRSVRLTLVASGLALASTLPVLAQGTTPQPVPPAASNPAAPQPATPDAPPALTSPEAPAEAAPPAPAASDTAPAVSETSPFSSTAAKADPALGSTRVAPLNIPTDIVIVRVLGPWSAEGKTGFSRTIGKVSAGNLSLYVEWVTDEGDVVETTQIEESAETPQLALATIRSDTGDEESEVYFETPEDAQGFRETFVLMVGKPGDARFGPATN
jgi:hypothetical protein